tara:strand:+ start:2060 stop:2869 length:810 start_codon:yes stop_codon:yes gene_type:complete
MKTSRNLYQGLKIIIVCILSFVFSCSEKQIPPGEIYARVSSSWLSSENIDSVFMVPLIDERDLPGMIDSWVENSLLYEEAIKVGLDKDKYLSRKRDDYYKQLLISSYLESELIDRVLIPEEAIKDYYLKNKSSFTRNSDEVFTEQFFLNNKEDGEKLKKLLLQGKKTETMKEKLINTSFGTIKKGFLPDPVDFYLFNKKNKFVGPFSVGSDIVVFKIVQSFKKGSIRGLDEVYDEVYQRVLHIKKGNLRFVLLDSLKSNSGVYINLKYR